MGQLLTHAWLSRTGTVNTLRRQTELPSPFDRLSQISLAFWATWSDPCGDRGDPSRKERQDE
jgi:hypothetical protein